MYIQSSHSLQVSSERHRTQSQNVQDALSKVCVPARCRKKIAQTNKSLTQLHTEIVRLASYGLRGETSPEQKKRVEALAKRERDKMRKVKQMRSITKSGRRAKAWDTWVGNFSLARPLLL